MPRFVIYDERAYIIEADDKDHAFERFCNMTSEQIAEFEVEGVEIVVQEISPN